MSVRFAGYAALFDRADRSGDVIRKGAFARAGKPLPILWQHDRTKTIGEVEHIAEDARGLRIIGRIGNDALVKAGAGLSFGYRVRAARAGLNRELTALDLIEVSIVHHPMQPQARVHAVEEVTTKLEKTNGL